MKTLLKIGFVSLLILTVWFCWPSLVVPLAVLALLACAFGTALAGTLAVFAGVGLVVVLALLGAALLLVLGLSPLWVPILLIVGLVHLLRRPRADTARTA